VMSQAKSQEFAGQSGRGRAADTPTEIPPPGWKDIVWRLYRAITEDRILLTAAGVTFYMTLALVPTLAAFVSIYGLFNNRATVIDQVNLLSGIVPSGGLEIIRDQLTRLTSESEGTLSITLLGSLAIALWSASAGVKALFEAMNVAYHEEEKRSFIKLTLLALVFTLGGAFAAILVLAAVVVVPNVLALLPAEAGLEWTIKLSSYVIMLVAVLVGIAALYRWGPSREEAKWRWITPGAILSVLALGVTSFLFSWYVSNFGNYNATYGSLGAMIGFLTWIWISVTVVIIGAELNSEIEHQTTRDSTTGAELPMGERGAYMADNVGKVWPRARDEDAAPAKSDVQRSSKPISWGTFAFVLPAALILGIARKRRER
jgi:membrane protein